jgi:hypothetical protein
VREERVEFHVEELEVLAQVHDGVAELQSVRALQPPREALERALDTVDLAVRVKAVRVDEALCERLQLRIERAGITGDLGVGIVEEIAQRLGIVHLPIHRQEVVVEDVDQDPRVPPPARPHAMAAELGNRVGVDVLVHAAVHHHPARHGRLELEDLAPLHEVGEHVADHRLRRAVGKGEVGEEVHRGGRQSSVVSDGREALPTTDDRPPRISLFEWRFLRLAFGAFDEFDEDAAHVFRMHEAEQRAAVAAVPVLGEGPHALAHDFGHRFVDAVDAIGHVVQSGAALLEELRNGGIGRRGREQLDARFAAGDHRRAHLLVGDVDDGAEVVAAQLAVRLDRRVEVGHGDADVVDSCEHACIAARWC